MSNDFKHKLKWSDVAGHPVVVCPICKGESECGSPNYYSLKSYGICATCRRKDSKEKDGGNQ